MSIDVIYNPEPLAPASSEPNYSWVPPNDEPITPDTPVVIETEDQARQYFEQIVANDEVLSLQSADWKTETVEIIKDIIIGGTVEVLVDLLRDVVDNRPETWDRSATYNSYTEQDFARFWYDLNTGALGEYNNRDFYSSNPFEDSSGFATWTSYDPDFLGAHSSDRFIGKDTDGDNRMDTLWRMTDSGELFIATESINGQPNWRPASEDERPDKYKKSNSAPKDN